MQKSRYLFAMSVVSLACATSAMAATPVDLRHQPLSTIQPLLSAQVTAEQSTLKQISSTVDFNQTTHIRAKQMYRGYAVLGGDAVIHVKRGGKTSLMGLSANSADTSMNGMVYQGLNADLQNTPAYVFSAEQAQKAQQKSQELYQDKIGRKDAISAEKSQLMVYVDKNNKAHYAFMTSFVANPAKGMPAKPVYILDAVSLDVYSTWNNIQTMDDVTGGGFGGNKKMGKRVYDGQKNDFPALGMQKDAKICFLENADVTVQDVRKKNQVAQFACSKVDKKYHVLWNGSFDTVNGAYSPSNDALYDGDVIKKLYQDWYNVPVLTKEGKPMMLVMRVHEDMENAYWDGQTMTFGDGGSMFYPLVSLGVGAHEVSHGFTEQHSGLIYSGQSGGLNESYSDMAAQAAEFYAYGKNSWQIGPEIFKNDGALRYMDEPTKDGASIDNANNYRDDLDVHYTSGVFNKFFYLLGTSNNWDTRKAFDVMVQANMHYWTPSVTFAEAACGVKNAALDHGYDLETVDVAAAKVGLDTTKC